MIELARIQVTEHHLLFRIRKLCDTCAAIRSPPLCEVFQETDLLNQLIGDYFVLFYNKNQYIVLRYDKQNLSKLPCSVSWVADACPKIIKFFWDTVDTETWVKLYNAINLPILYVPKELTPNCVTLTSELLPSNFGGFKDLIAKYHFLTKEYSIDVDSAFHSCFDHLSFYSERPVDWPEYFVKNYQYHFNNVYVIRGFKKPQVGVSSGKDGSVLLCFGKLFGIEEKDPPIFYIKEYFCKRNNDKQSRILISLFSDGTILKELRDHVVDFLQRNVSAHTFPRDITVACTTAVSPVPETLLKNTLLQRISTNLWDN